MTLDLHADRAELDRFVNLLFRYADPHTFASLRAFDQVDRTVPTTLIRPVKINGDLSRLIDEAERAAEAMANHARPIVFAPPICTFSNPDRARVADLANGLTLSVEIDDGDTAAARRKLESLLGAATVIVESGGEWSNPDTGEVHPKLHLHWRLSEPTRDSEDHHKLRIARDMAARLVGADPTGKPVVHPLRWPGSWNRKSKPRLARIVAFNDDAEIHLPEASERLQEAIEGAGLASVGLTKSSAPQASTSLVASALMTIPNPGTEVHYDTWIKYGYAIYRATGGNGYDIWDEWSQKSEKYNSTEQEAAWKRIEHAIAGSKETRTIGAGTIFFEAAAAGWKRPEWDTPPPETPDDPGYWASIQSEAALAATPQAETAHTDFTASPLDWDEMLAVPPREWVYGHFLIRRFISILGAPGGTGKTAYAFAIALSVATGLELLDEKVHEPGNVWIYNLEDPKSELLRRINAATIHHRLSRDMIEGRVFLDSGRDRPLVIAKVTREGDIVASPVVPLVIEEIKRRAVKVMIVDPFVRSHRLEENVNEQIDFAAALWGEVADKADCAILLLHHFKKGGVSGDAGAFRGASALIDASRAAISLAPMSSEEADKLGVEATDRWRYVRADNAKLNLAPPPESTTWLRLVGEPLGNATGERPDDVVQSVDRWEPPSPWDGMTMAQVIAILERIGAGPGDGERYTLTRGGRSSRWAGAVIVEYAHKKDGQAQTILKKWSENGLLEQSQYLSPATRRQVNGVLVNRQKMGEMLAQQSSSGASSPD